jgi:hypothetical protein
MTCDVEMQGGRSNAWGQALGDAAQPLRCGGDPAGGFAEPSGAEAGRQNGERVTPPSRLWCTSDMGGYSYRGQAWSGVRMCSQ